MKWTAFMRAFTLTHLSDAVLLRDLAALVAQDRITTAALVAHIAEVDARRLYLPAGYPSMHAYCVGELRLSEDAAYKRIQAARAGRQFPAVFVAIAEGRLHLAAVCLLAPHLTQENADGLLRAAAHQTKSGVEQLLAQRFPRTEVLPLVQVIPSSPLVWNEQLAPGQIEPGVSGRDGACARQLAPGQVEQTIPRPTLAPLSAESFALQFTIGKDTHDKLRCVQELLSHRLPSGDIAQVFDRALDALLGQLEKRKFAATAKPRQGLRRASANPRHIPAHVKRAVWQRDQGQCTFVGETGHRCSARKFLEFDHVDPVARGGLASVDGIRLRCRGHNQYEAEQVFGAGFMSEKRDAVRNAAAESRARTVAASAGARVAVSEVPTPTLAHEHARDVMAGLRELGFRADEVRRATEFSQTLDVDTLEERMRAALKFLRPRTAATPPAQRSARVNHGVARSGTPCVTK